MKNEPHYLTETTGCCIIIHIIQYLYHIIGLERQNRLKVGTDKPKTKVKTQSVSDDNVRKRLLEESCFELVTKGVLT